MQQTLKIWLSQRRLLVMVVISGSIALTFIILSPTFQECIKANQSGETYQSTKEYLSAFFGMRYWCAGIFFKENGDALTALATVAVAAFTGTLWWSTASAGELTKKTVALETEQVALAKAQDRLAKMQLLALNRPIVEIRSIGVDSSGAGGLLFQPGFPVKGHLVVRNVGNSPALILESGYRFYVSRNGLPMVPQLKPGESKDLFAHYPEAMDAHASCAINIESEPLTGEATTIDARIAFGAKLWVIGAIRYSDTAGTERWMGFCREYTPTKNGIGEGSFLPVQNPDYEYQDG